jgi:putative SOS response-associated peptidase YedK
MCYDIAYSITLESIVDYFGELVFDDPQIEIEFTPMDHMQGVAIFGKHPIIYESRDDSKLHCKMMEWGIIRFFEKIEPAMLNRNKMLNIRSERILDDQTSYWYKIRNRRCIIPLSVTYEHRAIVGWKKKVPYAVRPKADPYIFGVPGLYSVAEIADQKTGEMVKRWTFAMITRKANSLMRNIHNDGENRHRMPLFLPKEMLMEFVSNNLSEERLKEIISYEMPPDELEYWPVWTIRTSKPRPDGKCKTDYFEWPNLPPLGQGNPPLEELIED